MSTTNELKESGYGQFLKRSMKLNFFHDFQIYVSVNWTY